MGSHPSETVFAEPKEVSSGALASRQQGHQGTTEEHLSNTDAESKEVSW